MGIYKKKNVEKKKGDTRDERESEMLVGKYGGARLKAGLRQAADSTREDGSGVIKTGRQNVV